MPTQTVIWPQVRQLAGAVQDTTKPPIVPIALYVPKAFTAKAAIQTLFNVHYTVIPMERARAAFLSATVFQAIMAGLVIM